MNALELAEYLESDESLTNKCNEAAAMLRRQYEYVKTLRESLKEVIAYVDEKSDEVRLSAEVHSKDFVAAKDALAATENPT